MRMATGRGFITNYSGLSRYWSLCQTAIPMNSLLVTGVNGCWLQVRTEHENFQLAKNIWSFYLTTNLIWANCTMQLFQRKKEEKEKTLKPSLGSINRSVCIMGSHIFDVLNTGQTTVGILFSVQDTMILRKALTNWRDRSLEII